MLLLASYAVRGHGKATTAVGFRFMIRFMVVPRSARHTQRRISDFGGNRFRNLAGIDLHRDQIFQRTVILSRNKQSKEVLQDERQWPLHSLRLRYITDSSHGAVVIACIYTVDGSMKPSSRGGSSSSSSASSWCCKGNRVHAFLLLPVALAVLSLVQVTHLEPTDNSSLDKLFLPPVRLHSPNIVWLASYPNSGTSYTMTLVERASNRSTATNYGVEVTDKRGVSLPVHPTHPEGPYWEGLSGKLGTVRHLPTAHVLTKTHCGGRCVHCGPDEYLTSTTEFLDACARTSARVQSSHRRIEGRMSPRRVSRMVHLIRNPMHNTVARFHLERRHLVEKDAAFTVQDAIPNNATGFSKWCRQLDDEYAAAEAVMFDAETLLLLQAVPCRGEFFKYAQWHNAVRDMVPLMHDSDSETALLPVLTIHYEDYQDNFNATVDSLFQFLELTVQGKVRPFRALPDYSDHYTPANVAAIEALLRHVASPHTWEMLERYFP